MEHTTAETEPEVAASLPRNWRNLLSQSDLTLVGLVLVIKVILFIYGAFTVQVYQNRMLPDTSARLAIWNQWDSVHYVGLATEGYQATGEYAFRLVFYPLYPWLARTFALVTGDAFIGALIVSTLASLALAVVFNWLGRLDFGAATARRAVVFLFIFPTSYFLHIGYTESLFLLLAVGSFYAARTERWWLAGILGALAAFTRVNGLLLGPALAVEAWLQYRQTRKLRWDWAAVPLVGTGFLAYLYLNRAITGDWFRFQAIQREKWSKYIDFRDPLAGIRELFHGMEWRGPWEKHMVCAEELIFIALGLLVMVWCWRRMRASYSVWVTLNMLLFVSTSFIQSTPRYALILFPMFFMFARAAARPLWQTSLTVWSLLFLSFFAGQFAEGRWAF